MHCGALCWFKSKRVAIVAVFKIPDSIVVALSLKGKCKHFNNSIFFLIDKNKIEFNLISYTLCKINAGNYILCTSKVGKSN